MPIVQKTQHNDKSHILIDNPDSMPTVLIIAASPLDQDRLRLGVEVKEIRNALQRSRNRENWRIESNEAVTVDDLRRALLDVQPTVVHFAGHGTQDDGICFEDSNGYTHATGAEQLARLFHHFKSFLKCVVLNSCFSKSQAEVIRQEIDYVVGMRASITDLAASRFAVSFYDAIFAGTDFRTAFDLGCTSLDLNHMPECEVPIIFTSLQLEGVSLRYDARVLEIERFLHSYLNTPFQYRAKYTTSGETLEPQIKQHYLELVQYPIDAVRLLGQRQLNRECWQVDVHATCNGETVKIQYYLRIVERDIKLEWEASVGLWSIPPKTYLSLGSREDVIARVRATLCDYYNHDFCDLKDEYQSIDLETYDHDSLTGYVRRGTDVYESLIKILSDGKQHAITLLLANVRSQSSIPIIKEVLSSTWVYHEASAPRSSP